MKLEKQNILILSNEPWGNMWFSKHNYANELSKSNNVYFLNPPAPFSLLRIFNTKIKETKIQPTLTVLEYSNSLPVSVLGLWKPNDKIVFRQLKKYFAKANIKDLLFWTFDPIRLAFPELLKPKKIIIHAVDAYLFTYPAESILAQKADHIFCVSEKIAVSYRKYNANVTVIPHAIPDDEFLEPIPSRTIDPIGIFVGTLDRRVDYPYNEYIITKFPEVTFRFVGKININNDFVNKLTSGYFKNAVFEKEKPFKEIKYEIRKSDFCFLFKDNSLNGNNISSHKMLQYFAHGKPIFCSELSEHTQFRGIIFMDNDRKKMEALIKEFLKEGDKPGLSEKRIEYASKHKFSTVLKTIEFILN